MDRQTKLRAIDRVVDYLKEHEEKHFEECEEHEKEHHIYNDVRILEQVAFDYVHPWAQTPKIEQMTSPRSYKPVANQFIIKTNNGTYFQSYNSVIAFRPYNEAKVYLDKETWDYSTTTGKYRNEFLNEGIQETRAKIKSGEYELVNLNGK